MKNVKRINENQLRAIVAESVKKALNEDLVGPNSTEYLSWDIAEFVQKQINENPRYKDADDIEALQMAIRMLSGHLSPDYEDDPNGGHTYGY